jgi:hypothetical protein
MYQFSLFAVYQVFIRGLVRFLTKRKAILTRILIVFSFLPEEYRGIFYSPTTSFTWFIFSICNFTVITLKSNGLCSLYCVDKWPTGLSLSPVNVTYSTGCKIGVIFLWETVIMEDTRENLTCNCTVLHKFCQITSSHFLTRRLCGSDGQTALLNVVKPADIS